MTRNVAWVALVGALAVSNSACDGFAQAMTSHTDVLARAAGHELSIEQAAALIAPHERIPAQPQVVDAVANLWVDYTLLATAAAQDSTLSNVNIDAWLRPAMEQQAVNRLRDEVIEVDSMMSDDDLRAEFERQQPGLQVRARHILLRLPTDATQPQRDSVLALAQQIRDRARGGEDFAELARQYGQDGSAQQGGDLGFFGRNAMIQQFEEAAFALQPGEISDVVQTVHGYHVIKVEERQTSNFEEMKESFRAQAIEERQVRAQEDYINSLTEPLDLRVEEGAAANAKEIAAKPGMQLRGRAGARSLVRYSGGALTAAEFLEFTRTLEPSQRGQLSMAPDDQITMILEQLARNEILVGEAARRGLEVPSTERDSVRRQIQGQLAMAARAAGLVSIQPQDGETMHQAIERKVRGFLDGILRGEQNILPLGVIGFTLREEYGGEVHDRAFDAVVTQVEQLRPPAPAAPPGQPQPQMPMPMPPDTGGAAR